MQNLTPRKQTGLNYELFLELLTSKKFHKVVVQDPSFNTHPKKCCQQKVLYQCGDELTTNARFHPFDTSQEQHQQHQQGARKT